MARLNRRRMLQLLGTGAVVTFSAPLMHLPGTQARAEEILDPESPQAKALGYVHDADDVDPEQYSRFEPGQICGNCRLIQGDPEAEWVGCSIFPGKKVARDGWCNAWVPKG